MEASGRNSPNLAADEVSLKLWIKKIGNFRRYLLFKWKMLLLVIILGGSIGLLYATFDKALYTAQCTFVLEEGEKSGAGIGQYSSIASMVGIDVSSGGGLFQGDNIIELYKSRLMLSKTLFSKVNIDGKNLLLIDRYIYLNKLRNVWKNDPILKDINFNIPKKDFTVKHDSIVGTIVDDINKNYLNITKPDKKLTIISVKVKSTDPLFAKGFTDNLVNTVNSFYVQTKTKGVVRNIQLLQRQADSVRGTLNSSISGTAAALDVYPNPNPTMQSLRVPSQKRQIDVQASSAIYAEVVKNLEVAKGSLQRETPLIQIIDEPILPLPVEKTGKLKAVVTGMFATGFILVIWLLVIKVYRSVMN